MFTLKTFIQSIQEAVLNANDALMDRNLDLLNKYFEKDIDDQEVQYKMDQALKAAEEVMNPDTKVSKRSFKDAIDSIKDLKNVLSESDSVEQALAEGDIRPKTVILNYPTTDTDGSVKMKEVHVPLITLIPVIFSKVEELRLQADLELNLVDDEVQVSLGKFSGRKNASPSGEGEEAGSNSGRSIGSVDILLKPQEASDGMQQIIDAYEKVLKAQLPH